jgi:hypothetical protein
MISAIASMLRSPITRSNIALEMRAKTQRTPEQEAGGSSLCYLQHSGGRRGIRTPGTREGPLVFKTNAIVRSAILPSSILASATDDLAAKVAIRFAACSESVGEVAESG